MKMTRCLKSCSGAPEFRPSCPESGHVDISRPSPEGEGLYYAMRKIDVNLLLPLAYKANRRRSVY